ncbi:MAG: hypothetical protein PVF26_19605 [Desulfobacterales bacterium]|jgi:hypothetical protein
MTKKQKYLLENKFEFLKLAYRITKYKILGEEPPEELLEKVRTARIAAGFSREELKNILKC